MPPPPPFDLAALVRQHGTALRSLARELVADASTADDVVQETWLGALRSPPRHDRALGGWLATVLHNAARVLRRSERRRAERERAAAAARAASAEDHAAAAARGELAHRLIAAVQALDAPFRDAIWDRYFEGKAPRVIAHERSVPLATLKSRLQRGLGMLRDQLGKDGAGDCHGDVRDWRTALVATFGLHEGNVVAIATGGVLVATWTKVAAAAAVVAISALWWWPPSLVAEPAPASTVAPAEALAARVEARNGETDAARTTALAERTDASARAGATPPIAPRPGHTTIRGRCVAGDGRPFAGAVVSLRGSERSRDAMAEYLVDHEPPAWQDPAPQTTGVDGTFEFVFVPPPPFHFWCDVRADGSPGLVARWLRLAPDVVVDAGDVVLRPGATVRGRVVDAAQRPVAAAPVQFLWLDYGNPPDGTFHAYSGVNTRSGPDGTFLLHVLLHDGKHRATASAPGSSARATIEFTIVAAHVEPLTIVLPDAPAARTIRGVVRDDVGQPVARATVEWHGGEGIGSTTTKPDGAFVVVAKDGTARGPVRLIVSAEGFEPSSAVHAVWGRDDVAVTLTRAGELTIRATTAERSPVTKFSVRFQAADGSRSETLASIRPRGPSADGVLSLPGMPRGEHVAIVEFPLATGWSPRFERFTMPSGAHRIEVRAEPPRERTLRVVRADGSPVAGTRVQLCVVPQGGLDERTLVVQRAQWLGGSAHKAFVVHDTQTATDGRCTLVGDPAVRCALRVLGPGHVPLERVGVQLDGVEELVVAVTTGATLRGRIVPAEARAELERLARVASEAGAAETRAHVRLWRDDARYPAAWARDDEPVHLGASVRADGSFEWAGLPPGAWRVDVTTYGTVVHAGGMVSSPSRVSAGPRVVLSDGTETVVDVDLLAIVPGRLRGTVSWNGAPLANAAIVLASGKHARPPRGADGEWINLRTDAEGRFEQCGPADTFDLAMWSGPNDAKLPVELWADGSATVTRGATTEHTFAVASGTLELTVRDAAGAPVAGVVVHTVGPDSEQPPTDDAGRVTVTATARTAGLRVLPKVLQAPEEQQRVWLAARLAKVAEPFAEHWLDLGAVTVIAGQTTRHEVRLPAVWDR